MFRDAMLQLVIIMSMGSANERWHNIVTSLIGCDHTHNDPCNSFEIENRLISSASAQSSDDFKDRAPGF